jgi:hypothetical protein
MSMSMSMPGVHVCVHVHVCDHASDLSVFLVTPLTLSVRHQGVVLVTGGLFYQFYSIKKIFKGTIILKKPLCVTLTS